MSNATAPSAPSSKQRSTIRPEEAAHFGKLAHEWWDPKGSSAMLHKLNPVRLGFIRDSIDHHWRCETRDLRPLSGKKALDVGCGAGLLCEPLARLGALVTGVDAAAENIIAAKTHAHGSNLTIDYRCDDVARLGLTNFDLVTSMEVIEHVSDKQAFLNALAAALADDGLMILSTPNRTMRSKVLLVEGAERLGAVPRGTHHWEDFIVPEELEELALNAGLTMGIPQGISWTPSRGLHISGDLALNYIVTLKKK